MTNADFSLIEGLVFDLDGTLISSTIDFLQMRRQTFERMHEAGVPDIILDGTKSIISNLKVSVRYLTDRGSIEASRSLSSDAGRIMSEIEMLQVSQTKAVRGTSKALDQLIGKGYSVAVLTRGSRRYTEAALSAAGLTGYFPNTVCRDDHLDEEAKPNPISMVRAAGKMGMRKEKCLLVGDHTMDLDCALSAGTGFVGVLSGATDLTTWTKLGNVTVVPDVSYLPDLFMRR
ncbi:MAG: HAD family hydrolase [Methanomassiliicoccales archaeon]|jgi:phosphoglycolate phosphatase-like HAD superfamily hydrolase